MCVRYWYDREHIHYQIATFWRIHREFQFIFARIFAQVWQPVYSRSRDGRATEILRAILRPRPKKPCLFMIACQSNEHENLNCACRIRPKWRLDSEYFHLGLTPRSSSVCPLLTNISQVYYECLPTLANAFTNVANAFARFTYVINASENHAEWPSSQHSLKLTNRFVNWAIDVRRWGIICERSEFVTNAYEDTANAAKFERLSNMSFR